MRKAQRMIQPRKRFLAVIVLMAVALFWAHSYIQSPEFQNYIENAVEESLSNSFDADIKVEKISLGFFSVKVSGANLSVPLNSVHVKIDDIKVGFSLSALLKKKWSPDELIDKIILINPEIIYEPLFEEDEEAPSIKPSDIADAVLANVKIRELVIRNCKLTIVNKYQKNIITIDNLSGRARRTDDSFYLSLNNRKRLKKSRFAIDLVLSRDIAKQTLSVQADNYNLRSYFFNPEKAVNTVIDGSLEFGFIDKQYPSCLIPSGEFSIKDLTYGKKKSAALLAKEITFTANEGVINSNNFTLHYGSSTLSSTLTASFSEGFLLLGSHFTDTLLGIQASAVVEHDSTMNSGDYRHSFSMMRDSLVVTGYGTLSNSGMIVDTGTLSYPGVVGKLTGVWDYSTEYTGKYEGKFLRQIDSATTVEGDFFLSFNNGLTIIPEISGTVLANIKNEFMPLSLPKLTVSLSSLGVLQANGENRALKISAKVPRLLPLGDTLPEIELGLTLKKRLLKKLEPLLFKSNELTDGTIEVHANILNDSIPLTVKSLLVSKRGRLKLYGSVTVKDKNDILFSLPRVSIIHDSITVPMSIQGTYNKGFLDVDFMSNTYNVTGRGIFDIPHNECITASLNLKKSNLSLLNGLFPQLKDFSNGTLSAQLKSRGHLDSLIVFGDFKIDSLQTDGVRALSLGTSFKYEKKRFSVAPFSLVTVGDTILKVDSLTYDTTLYVDGQFHNIALSAVLDDKRVPQGGISGIFKSEGDDGLYFVLSADSLRYDETHIDSLSAVLHIVDKQVIIDTFSCKVHALQFNGNASFPFVDESTTDSLKFSFQVEGDLLKTADQYKTSSIGGTSNFRGECSGSIASGKVAITKGRFRMWDGAMTYYPYLWEPMDSVTMKCDIHGADSIYFDVVGKVKRRRIRLKNSYRYADSLQPLTYGMLDLGVFHVTTPDGALSIFIPGFQENRKGNTALVAVKGKNEIRRFTLSGPLDRLKVTGTLLLRKAEFTFPILDDVVWPDSSDPFPFITFDLDIRPADRSVTYFYQLGDSKKRRGLRMIEADLDPSQTIALRGRDHDNTFKILGGLRAYRGYLFYGTTFDKNFEMGLDFRPEIMSNGKYDNAPIVWGKADNVVINAQGHQSQSSVKVMVKDSVSGELREHARFGDLVILPASEGLDDKSYDEKSALFYQETGRSITDPGKAGEMMGSIGDSYFNTVWLNFWGRRLARKIGFDVLRFETSLLSNSFNYFHERSISPEYSTSFGLWAFENSGITMGKYVFGDNLLLKAQTSLMVKDTLLTPSYNLGFEYQPFRYLWMDFHYGMHQDRLTDEIQFDPSFQLQMRVPLQDFKKVFKKRD